MDPANDNEVLPAIMPNLRSPDGIREAAGVLVTQSFLDRFPSTDTNANRHTVSEMSKRFIGLYIPLLASRPLEDGVFRNAVTDNPGCAVCHDVMDPMAGALQNWAPDNRYRPNGTGCGRGYSAELLQVDQLHGRGEGQRVLPDGRQVVQGS